MQRIIRYLAGLAVLLAGCAGGPAGPPGGPASASPAVEVVPTETRVPPVSSATAAAFSSATPSPSFTVSPSATFTAAPTLTLVPSPALTPTLGSDPAPRLEPIGVDFITSGSRDLPLVALTFDVGQTPWNPAGFDQGIYDALTEFDARATFFLGGDWIRTHITETRLLDQNPLIELGNHSWSHPDLRDLNEGDISAEILRTQDILFQVTGRQNRLFRLPSGFYNDLVLSVIAWHGLYIIQWDVVTADPVPDNEAENINKIVRERVQNGSIIVMHANGRGWHTAEALPEMITYLRESGYCLVTVSQMIGLEPVPADCGLDS